MPDAFATKDYPTYLTSLPQDLAPDRTGQIPLINLVRVAISLEKTGGWDKDAGKQAHDLLRANAPALKALNALQALIEEKAEALQPLVDSKMTSPMNTFGASRALRDSGFEFAANALGVLSPDMPGKRILYLCSIPPDKRAPIEAVFLAQVKDPPTRQMLAQSALEMFLCPPAGVTVDPHEFYLMMLKLGKDMGIINFDTAQEILQAGKKPDAIELVSGMAADRPTDENIQTRAAGFLWRAGDLDGGLREQRQ